MQKIYFIVFIAVFLCLNIVSADSNSFLSPPSYLQRPEREQEIAWEKGVEQVVLAYSGGDTEIKLFTHHREAEYRGKKYELLIVDDNQDQAMMYHYLKMQRIPGIIHAARFLEVTPRFLPFLSDDPIKVILIDKKQGRELNKKIEREGEGEIYKARAIDIILQLARTVRLLHNAGVTHGKIAPENIFIANSGRVFLTNFSDAKMSSDTEERDGDISGLRLTLAEMIPDSTLEIGDFQDLDDFIARLRSAQQYIKGLAYGDGVPIEDNAETRETWKEKFAHRFGEDFGNRLFEDAHSDLGIRFIPIIYRVEVGVRYKEFKEFIDRTPQIGQKTNVQIVEEFGRDLGTTKIYRAVALTEEEFQTLWNSGEDLLCRAMAGGNDQTFAEALEESSLVALRTARYMGAVFGPVLSVAVDVDGTVPAIAFQASLWGDKVLPPNHNLYIFTAEVPLLDLIPSKWEFDEHTDCLWMRGEVVSPISYVSYILYFPFNEYFLPERIKRKHLQSYRIYTRGELEDELSKLTESSKDEYMEAHRQYIESHLGEKFMEIRNRAIRVCQKTEELTAVEIDTEDFKDTLERRGLYNELYQELKGFIVETILSQGDIQNINKQLNNNHSLPGEGFLDYLDGIVSRAEEIIAILTSSSRDEPTSHTTAQEIPCSL